MVRGIYNACYNCNTSDINFELLVCSCVRVGHLCAVSFVLCRWRVHRLGRIHTADGHFRHNPSRRPFLNPNAIHIVYLIHIDKRCLSKLASAGMPLSPSEAQDLLLEASDDPRHRRDTRT